MKNSFYVITLIGFLLFCSCNEIKHESLFDKVNPFIGTEAPGNTYPGAVYPFGMVQLSPDNGTEGWNWIAGYYYPDSTINGFSHTHLSGTGAGDMYDIRFMPAIEPVMREDYPKDIYAFFDHGDENAHAGYYSVVLKPYDIKVELTALKRIGVQSYTFNRQSDSAFVLIDLQRSMNWDKTLDTQMQFRDSTTISGYRKSDGWARNQEVYFFTKLSKAPYKVSIDTIKTENDDKYCLKAKLFYKVNKGDRINVITALSGTSVKGAEMNFQSEAVFGFDFERYRETAEKAWQDKLSLIQIGDESDMEKTKFYTAMYHSMLCPTLYSDADGRYKSPDGKTGKYENGVQRYSTFSLWDTYRAAHPLYNIILHKESADMVRSLIDFGYENDGHLPVWNMWASETDMMIGFHSIPVIVDAINKGIYTDYDMERLKKMFRSTMERNGYRGLDYFNAIGYIPSDVNEKESVSKTMEYSFNAYCVSQWAENIGDTLMFDQFAKKGRNFANVFDSKTGFFAPRMTNGEFERDFNPFAYTDRFTESNAYQYMFAVQNDFDKLIELFGGKAQMEKRLDEMFAMQTPSDIELPIFSTGMIGQYVHGNEPSHHVAFLYNIVGKPHKTTDIINKICNELYTDKPDGLCGNEDCGQMSAWFVFASLGMYPLDPISGRYEMTTPRYKSIRINLPNGKYLSIISDKDRRDFPYIGKVTLDGNEIKTSYIEYKDIIKGGELKFYLTKDKNKRWY